MDRIPFQNHVYGIHVSVSGCPYKSTNCNDERHLPANPGTVGHRVEIWSGQTDPQHASHHHYPLTPEPPDFLVHVFIATLQAEG